MSNPYEDLSSQVALTELRDVSFKASNNFSCGHTFVLGHGLSVDKKQSPQKPRSPLKKERPSPSQLKVPGSTVTLKQDLSSIESLGNHEEQSSMPCATAQTETAPGRNLRYAEQIDESMQDLEQTL
jgi:hypothetical protein